MLLLTSVAHDAHRRRRKYQNALPQQSKLPEDEDLFSKELNELRHAASRVGDLGKKKGGGEERGETSLLEIYCEKYSVCAKRPPPPPKCHVPLRDGYFHVKPYFSL